MVVGSAIEELVRRLLDSYSVRVVGVCEVIPRVRALFLNGAARTLNQYMYLRGVLDAIPNVFCWQYRGFSEPSRDPYLPDGVHVNFVLAVLVVSQLSGRHLAALITRVGLSTFVVNPFFT